MHGFIESNMVQYTICCRNSLLSKQKLYIFPFNFIEKTFGQIKRQNGRLLFCPAPIPSHSMLIFYLRRAFLFIFILLAANVFAQQENANSFQPDERLFIEAKWKYTYTLHAESNTIIHKADNNYDYYLYFRYDYTYQEFLNDRLNRGNWSLDGNMLFYSFKHVNKFKIVELNKSVLTLEFTQRNSKGTYQYHFVRVDSKDAPFPKPANELPEVIVEADDPNAPIAQHTKKKKKRGWLSRIFRRNKLKETYVPAEELTYINIELIGGGYYGGIDPVLKDFILLKTDGRLIKEFQSVNHGLLVTKKYIPRSELELFADYIEKQGFFEMERVYDCTDAACTKRKRRKPTPVPLRLSVAYGKKKKVVTIAIWGEDDQKTKYVDYPPVLDNIIDAIQRMANRPEEPLVKK